MGKAEGGKGSLGLVPIGEVPFRSAITLDAALKEFRRPGKQRVSRKVLRRLAGDALARGALQAVSVRMPEGRVESVVNRETFPREFTSFLAQVPALRMARLRLAARLAPSPGRAGLGRGLGQTGLRFLSGNPLLLPLAERLFGRRGYALELAGGSRFNPNQNRSEILGLLDLLNSRRPRAVLEVGTSKGGTLYLFSKVADPAALLVSIDLRLRNRKLLQSFARARQRIELIEADSSAPATLARIRGLFPRGVDFLFLDGDHSDEGVRRDFDLYHRLVRPGGLLALHDIVPDNLSRYGVFTGGWAGGVPAFWQEMKPRYAHREFVADPSQDGRGIGVLFLPGPAAAAGD